ncbi:ABC transporter C family member 8 [Camellia lanceoleosa]|uniref:ABC transporter C family member 8 n=1 Tax=Camellia lanceoleosa TaxID=1840588 RepID=A0ACC0IBD6_9ERIC|nr:ABC transporter C family member 8 [Camellia lanceoleosa]
MKGYKVAICGSVGSGKSSLLCSILGEIPKISGWRIQVYGSKAYVLQSAWIQTGTNVLFGSKMDEELYESVLCTCALNKDVSNWVNGDLILVGERGTQLSGSQKPRNQLARAICSDSDVYFLDDPFSAVDALNRACLF